MDQWRTFVNTVMNIRVPQANVSVKKDASVHIIFQLFCYVHFVLIIRQPASMCTRSSCKIGENLSGVSNAVS
jgi:hypothetical protein